MPLFNVQPFVLEIKRRTPSRKPRSQQPEPCYTPTRKGLQRRKELAMQPVSADDTTALTLSPKGVAPYRTRGPYADRKGYRVNFIEPEKQWSKVFKTLSAARAAAAAFEKRHATREALTVNDMIERYAAYQIRKGSKPETVQDYRSELTHFFGYCDLLEQPLGGITHEMARRIYLANSQRPKQRGTGTVSAATHQHSLKLARQLYEWAVQEKEATSNPFAGVKPIGRANKGKPQLSVDEATRWLDTAMEMVEQRGDVLALAATLLPGTGARISEIATRRVRDLDERGATLRVKKGKNERANRPLQVPTRLVPYLAALAANRPGDELLFLADRDRGKPEPRRITLRQRLNRKVTEICRLAGVERVVPHSFRGLYATLGVSHSGDRDLVARQLGHGSPKITEQCYIDNRVASAAQQQRVQAKLGLLDAPAIAQLPSAQPEALEPEYLTSMAQHLDPEELGRLIQGLFDVMKAKAAQVGPLAIKPRSMPKPDRSRSKPGQVCGSLRKLSARASSSSFSDGE
jgi:integrase